MSIDLNINELEYEKNYDGYSKVYNLIKNNYEIIKNNGIAFRIERTSTFEVLELYIDKILNIENEIENQCNIDDDDSSPDKFKVLLLLYKFNDLKNEIISFKQEIIYNKRLHMYSKRAHEESVSSTNLINDVELKTSNELKDINDKVTIEFEKYEKQLEESERKVVSHSTNFMSLLAAIIAIVVSSITTASTWLNNTNKDGLAIAIIAPAFVIIIAILVLLSFCSLIYNKELWIKIVSSAILTTGIVVIVLYAIKELPKLMDETKYANASHTLIILDENEYDVIDEKYFSFEYENVIYQFDYDESYFHDDNLYFCIEHKTLE